MASEMDIKACCVASYTHPLARWLLGDSLHPGGLTLTTRLARMAGVSPQSLVLDVGSGLGASSVHLAETLGCKVTGVTLESEGVAYGMGLARQRGVADKLSLIQGDVMDVGLPLHSFDVVLMECVLSIIMDKLPLLSRLYSAIKPGGRLAFSDVTLNGPLPEEFQGVTAFAACLAGAMSMAEYRLLMEAAGFTVEYAEDLQPVALSFLRGVRGRLLMAEVASGLGKAPVNRELLTAAKTYLATIEDLVREGKFSYGMLIARTH